MLDAKAINPVTRVFVALETSDHSAARLERFSRADCDAPEPTEIYFVSSDVQYLLRIVVPDIDTCEAVKERLIGSCNYLDISVSFVLETIEHTTALPLSCLHPT